MIARNSVSGYSAVYLENELLRIGVLPEKGADIFEIACTIPGRSEPVQLLMRTPWGLKPRPEQPPIDFLDNYEGGWQELFPNANDACEYRGRQIPFHGEVALETWKLEPPAAATNELHLWVECSRTPFRLERTMSLDPAESMLTLREKVTNLSSEPADFVWGHHITLGGDFLQDGCILNIPAHDLYTAETLYEPLTARLEPAQSGRWPFARTRRGGLADLSRIPGPTAHSHDDVILGGLERGFYELLNPRLELAFSLEWDAGVFPWLMYWQPYGGADLPPLTGIYGVGLEPWVSRYPLARAVEEGQARRLAGRESLETELVAAVRQI